MAITAADMHGEAKKPLNSLKAVPSDSWNVEAIFFSHGYDKLSNFISSSQVRRFYNEVSVDVVALTGLKLFSVTRKLMLSVVAKVITYEIFMIQLDQASESNESAHDFCNV